MNHYFAHFFSFLGTFPNCKQMDMNHNYNFNAYLNQFIILCPKNATGILHPYCDCYDYDHYYDAVERVCKSNMGRMCPELSFGTGPDCWCIKYPYGFVKSLWGCFFNAVSGSPPFGICPDINQPFPMCDVSIAP